MTDPGDILREAAADLAALVGEYVQSHALFHRYFSEGLTWQAQEQMKRGPELRALMEKAAERVRVLAGKG